MTFEKLKNMFLAYVENDFGAADPAYVKEVLEDVCGMSKEDAKELGLDWVFDED